MLKRALPAALLLVIGGTMLGTPNAAPLGVLLVIVALAVLVYPVYLRRSRAG